MNIQRWSPSKRASTFTPLVHIDGAVRDSDDTSLVPLPEAMPHSSGAPRKAGALKFFLVEDNVIIRENLAETLHEMVGAEVVGISDIQSEATRWLCDPTHEWDVAIIDIFLKQGNGVQIVAALQHARQQKQVIVLSNYASPEIRTQCLRLGADAVFDKSTELDDLLEFCANVKLH